MPDSVTAKRQRNTLSLCVCVCVCVCVCSNVVVYNYNLHFFNLCVGQQLSVAVKDLGAMMKRMEK